MSGHKSWSEVRITAKTITEAQLAAALQQFDDWDEVSAEAIFAALPDGGLDVERLAAALVETGLMQRLNDYGYAAHQIARETPLSLGRSWAKAIAAAYAKVKA